MNLEFVTRIKWQTVMFWFVYLFLLAVLLPHTAWAFEQFEPEGGRLVAWSAAVFFELTIAVLTHKLSGRLNTRRTWKYKYLNPYMVGLIIAVLVSVAANLAHAVQFGSDIAVYDDFGIVRGLYVFSFGAILPLASLVFAWVLSGEEATEERHDPEVDRLNARIKELEKNVRAANKQAAQANRFIGLLAENKKDRIQAAHNLWPDMAYTGISEVTGASVSYISETLKTRTNGAKEKV